MFVNLKRVLKTTLQDMKRNRYTTLSSISVMTLVFLVFSIFSIFAYSATKFLEYVETREHLEVFFQPGTEEENINEIKAKLEETDKTTYVNYTTQEEAAEFLRERHSDNPLILDAISAEALPPSLAVRAKKIDYVPQLNKILELEDPNGEMIYKISYNEDTTNLLKDLLFWVRISGGVLLVFLIGVIFLVSLITVEITIATREEEISIMRLVGGGRWYIRAPFIFQGVIFGLLGALFAGLIILGAGFLFKFLHNQSPTLSFISRFFADLNWPEMTPIRIVLIILAETLLGAIIGGINSLLAVFRHFK